MDVSLYPFSSIFRKIAIQIEKERKTKSCQFTILFVCLQFSGTIRDYGSENGLKYHLVLQNV